MDKKIYIIGVDHLIQYKNSIIPAVRFAEFKDYLAQLISKHSITVVAEEFNEEYLSDVYFSDEATVRSAAERSGVMHLFCDPGEDDRLFLGIPYFADIRNMVNEKYGISEKIILDRTLSKKINQEVSDESKKYWALREEFWYGKIADFNRDNILFVCGHEHALRFKELLDRTGRSAEVIEQFWRREIFSDYHTLGIG
jgi:hypothetical protein